MSHCHSLSCAVKNSKIFFLEEPRGNVFPGLAVALDVPATQLILYHLYLSSSVLAIGNGKGKV